MFTPQVTAPTSAFWHENFSDACDSVNPGPPLSVAAAATDDTGVTLSWLNPSPLPPDLTGGGGYVIESRNGPSGAWAALPVALSPVYYPVNALKDTSVKASEGEYCYRLKTFDSCARRRRTTAPPGPTRSARPTTPAAPSRTRPLS